LSDLERYEIKGFSEPQRTRLITCQGSIQLVTALSVMAHRDQNASVNYQNYLVIYELYAPDQQHREFAAFIQKMAESVCDWVSIVYLAPETINTISRCLNSTSPQKIYGSIYDLIGIETADEIYLCRNWQFTNLLLLNAYRSAQKICYGDGIGIYFSETSAVSRQPVSQIKFAGPIDWFGWKLHGLEQRIRKALNLKTILHPIEFDIGYFVLPEIFGEAPPMPTMLVDRSRLLVVFNQLTPLLDLNYVKHFQALIADSPVSILLTSNLSELRRLSQQHEIFAYREFLVSHRIHPDEILLIKPHPRDDIEKIQALRFSLSNLYREIVILDHFDRFFLPFEILFLQAFSNLLHDIEIRVFAVSSACLSLKLLFNVSSFIGFGSELTATLFNSDYVDARLEHEQILRQALNKLNIEATE
jgi:hypothetical protein